MTLYTQKQLKALVRSGAAIDITNASSRSDIPERYKQIGYAESIYGCGGRLFRGLDSGRLYAITSRTTAIYIF